MALTDWRDNDKYWPGIKERKFTNSVNGSFNMKLENVGTEVV